MVVWQPCRRRHPWWKLRPLCMLPRWRSRELSKPGIYRHPPRWRLCRGDDAKQSDLMSIPNDLSSVDAAPLLCAGLTTFNALRNAPVKAGDLVAVLGIGGLAHLGVQYARHMGFEVAAIGRGADKESSHGNSEHTIT